MKSSSIRSPDCAPDLESDGEGAFRVERKRHQRLADLAAPRRLLDEQTVGLKLAHDDRHGLRRQAGQPRDLGLGQAAVAADQRQRQALVIELTPVDSPLWVVPRGDGRPRPVSTDSRSQHGLPPGAVP